jgi:hypothetical protein
VTLVAILHDLCKMGFYVGTEKPFRVNKRHPRGHAQLSLDMALEVVDLTKQEMTMIAYHMGMYGTVEFASSKSWMSGEYSLDALVDAFSNPQIKIVSLCDELAAMKENIRE